MMLTQTYCMVLLVEIVSNNIISPFPNGKVLRQNVASHNVYVT
jgi:hypothetical protein